MGGVASAHFSELGACSSADVTSCLLYSFPFRPESELKMGICLPCLNGAGAVTDDVVETPDPELKRRQLAEAAEKRQMESSSRGVKNPHSVEHKKKRQEEIEKQEKQATETGPSGGGGLRWQVG